jgi:phosphoglycerate kinase
VAKLSITDVDVNGKRVLVRVDFNVPLGDGAVADATRLRASLPTIQYIIEHGGIPVLMSHLGRPGGKVLPEASLRPVASRLGELLGGDVTMADDCVGDAVEALVKNASAGDVVLLENLRYHAEEEANDPAFARALGELGDVYVNDAFGTAHRAHASTEGVTHHFVTCAAGFLVQKELDYLGQALTDPKRPFVAIMGGAKISGKIDVIENLLPRVDALLIGGGMAYTFYKAMGLEIGNSLLDEERLGVAEMLLQRAAANDLNLVLPVDCVAASELKEGAQTTVVSRDAIPAELQGLDIGPETRKLFADEILKAKTVVWNGPVGVFEMKPFDEGTRAIADALVSATENGATTVIGGGETAAAVAGFGLADKVSHVSTGGGASLEFLEGKVLPGVAALTDK